ncbi:hypothetical protein LSH36_134g05009, partial [Paralvinella palmiformis]
GDGTRPRQTGTRFIYAEWQNSPSIRITERAIRLLARRPQGGMDDGTQDNPAPPWSRNPDSSSL